ncbi:DUF6385 domain-containing protein [Sporomusa termitida]|uniref:DUF6385 domain-containing protein n=1 Tax=Sporomusa termitida TaxID=2377 RepID=A0A517DZ67_9FIRM|nr:DUF6385 domain-containing protein [Sporomusa termitida]QDR82546.1 hypothetical protein SPTER_39740 [Sporomusa termitida]
MGEKTIKPPVKNITLVNSRCRQRRFSNKILTIGRKKRVFQSLIDFDITALPPCLTILRGTLNVFVVKNTCFQEETTIDAHQIFSAWCKRKAILFNTEPAASAVAPAANAGCLTFDLTSLVTDWYTGVSANLGVLLQLRNQQEPGLIGFCSNRAFDSRCWPFLQVTFLEPLPGDNNGHTLDTDARVTTGNNVRTTAKLNVQHFNYTYYVINTGTQSASVALELSPDGINWMTDVPQQIIAPGVMKTFVPGVIARFACLTFQSTLPEQHTDLNIYVRGSCL